MRKLTTPAVLVILLGASPQARGDGPSELQCKNQSPKAGDPFDAVAGHRTRNCFDGEIFVLDGGGYQCPNCDVACDPTAPDRGLSQCAEDKTGTTGLICDPETRKCAQEIVVCASDSIDPKAPNGCRRWNLDHGQAVQKLISIVSKVGPLPEYEQIVVWATDYVTGRPPLFERLLGKNKVDGLGLRVSFPEPQYRFLGWVVAGSTSVVDNEINDAYLCGAGVGCNVPQGYANILDALAQTAASAYLPYVKFKTNASWQKTTDLNYTSLGETRQWTALVDLKGDLMGGNNWRDNGNGTFEIAQPPPLRGVIPPFEGLTGLIFTPIDLYLFGFLPQEQVPPMTLFDRGTAVVTRPKPQPTYYGTAMGIRPGLQIRPDKSGSIGIDQITAVEGNGPRDPGFKEAPHYFRQLWVAVTLPGITPETDVQKTAKTKVPGALVKLQKWRRSFAWYFYMMTRWTGRIITTFEGTVDDSPYWEFGQPMDDIRAFRLEGGLAVRDPEMPGGVLAVNTPGSGGRMVFGDPGYPLPLRIDPNHFNAVLVRMRIAPGTLERGKAHALVSFPGGPQNIALPGSKDAFLIPDGLWHTYSANLSTLDGWVAGNRTYPGLTVVPSDLPATGIEIDFVRVIHTEEALDKDFVCGSKEKVAPDGWINDFDNCPDLYNPGQEDGNTDGVGDACEDFDNDTIPNACDNCPTLTNNRQRDSDNDGLGDNCDDDIAGCCLTPGALGGVVRPGAGLFAGALVLAAALALVARRRRRR